MSGKIKERRARRVTQWMAVPLLPVVLVGGYYWPYLGFIVIALIAIFMVVAAFRGRLYCGWICPMGAFHERILSMVSIKDDIPHFMKQPWFRWLVFAGMMSFLAYRLYLTGGHELKVASVFRIMWIVSTSAAILIGLFFKPRTWCKVCPMGFMQGIIGKNAYRVQVSQDCKQCGLCANACPIQTYPGAYKEQGYVDGTDCLRCFNCVQSCPRGALSIEKSPGRCSVGSGCDPAGTVYHAS